MARGGYRPGAGRPKKAASSQVKPEAKSAPRETSDPLDYMLAVMNDPEADNARRDRMAIAAAPYVHGRADSDKPGKKEQKQAAAQRASSRFAVPEPPKASALN